MTSNFGKAYGQHPHDPLAGYKSAVSSLNRKLAKIAEDSQQTCGHLSRAATALRSIARAGFEARQQPTG